MKDFVASVVPQILEIFRPLFLASATWVCWKLVGVVSAHTKRLNTETSLLVLNDAVKTAVESVEQTFAKKSRDEDGGKLSEASAVVAKATALGSVKRHIGEVGITKAMSVLDITPAAMDELIGDKVEAHVLKLTEVKYLGTKP